MLIEILSVCGAGDEIHVKNRSEDCDLVFKFITPFPNKIGLIRIFLFSKTLSSHARPE